MNDAERRRSVFERLLAQEGIGAPLADRIVPRDASLRAPLSFAQETLWLLDRASPGMTAYNSAVARRVHGVLDSTALRSALDGLAARHEALRTVVDAAGDQPTLDVRPAAAVPLALADLRSQPPAKREGAAHAWLRALADTPFDLTRDLPLRAGLAQVADDEYVFLLLTHHIASDAWSYGIMFRELTALYDAARAQKAAELPSPALQFADYAVWQRATLRGDRLERALSFWRERLAALPQLELPTDRPRSSVPAADGARCALTLPPTSLGGMQRLAHSHGATLYAVLLAAYAAVLHRIGGGEEVVVGSAVAGRTRRDLEEIVGYFSAALPMRIDFAGEPTFADVLRRTMDVTVSAFEHQNVPLEEVIAGMPGKFSRPEAPLFRAVLTMQDAMSESLRLGDATTEAFEIEGAQTKFDLTLLGTEKPDGLELSLWYRTDLFEATTARHLLARLHQVLESAVRDPRQRICALNLLLPVEREQLTAWNATTCRVGAYRTVPEGIAAAAARVPAATAVVCGEDRLTYAQLTSAAQRLGRRLRGAGVAPGDAVGLYLERSVEGIVAMLAAWDVGAAYVPLAIDVPVQRTLSQLAEGRITTVVTTASLLRDVPDTVRGIALDDEGRRDAGTRDVPADGAEAADSERRTCRPDDVAYVLFTSGSTGVPKGVAVTHGNLANYTQAILATLGVNDDAPLAFASVSPLSADLGNTAIFPALCSGGTLHIIRADVTTDAARFTSYAQRHPYDVLKITPSHLGALLDGATTATLLPRRTLVLGGEACAWELIERVRTLGRCDIVNHYGPTETTIGACTFAVDDQSFGGFVPATVPIGMP
ncbi:MAG: AMP-binding protein, partial [Candidatus Eremiobacteraeota bacterium]|nr:AMP-binding protein [Candidatus Eremiobacteraeota bacterium]